MTDNEYDRVTVNQLEFEKAYLNLRQQEGRLFNDEDLLNLPAVNSSHTHFHEWKCRKQSLQRLRKYLARKKPGLKILEIGCGNGWLSHKISNLNGSIVTGLDINEYELEQAKRVFGENRNLNFVYGDIDCIQVKNDRYDIILFAASIQYFPSFSELIRKTLGLLEDEGEIHVLDTHFYEQTEREAAVKRSEEYFSKAGFPQMAEHYFHHATSELGKFHHKILYRPKKFSRVFLLNQNPFPWICISKQDPE